jgi:hypothetical protein
LIPYHTDGNIALYDGDLRNVLPGLPEACADYVVTDPPYGLSFMGEGWDSAVPGPDYWRAIARVCKPGALLAAFGGTRTWHRLVCAIEDAGWEIRDTLMWLQGQGFPKSADVGKLIDKAKGAQREVIGDKLDRPGYHLHEGKGNGCYGGGNGLHAPGTDARLRAAQITAPATALAEAWTGWAFALKPAWEPIILAMKPLDGTIAHNAETWGVAGMNIDACRIGDNPGYKYNADRNGTTFHGKQGERIKQSAEKKGSQFIESTKGRWPANLLLDEKAAAQLDTATGVVNASRFFRVLEDDPCGQNNRCELASAAEDCSSLRNQVEDSVLRLAAIGQCRGAPRSNELSARFTAEIQRELRSDSAYSTQLIQTFVEKCSQESQHMLTGQFQCSPVNYVEIEGLTSIILITTSLLSTAGFVDLAMSSTMLRSWAVGAAGSRPRFKYAAKATKKERGEGNDHPTVKPLALMDYLLTLLSTPTGGVVLDPFAGSGSTLVAAKRLGRECIGVELDVHNCDIAVSRLNTTSR